jgi:hypothetical protein
MNFVRKLFRMFFGDTPAERLECVAAERQVKEVLADLHESRRKNAHASAVLTRLIRAKQTHSGGIDFS